MNPVKVPTMCMCLEACFKFCGETTRDPMVYSLLPRWLLVKARQSVPRRACIPLNSLAVRRRGGPPTPMEQSGGQKWSISGFPFLQLTLTLHTLPSLKMHARLLVRSALSLTFLSPGEGHRENERVAIFVEVLTCIKVFNGKESQI